MRCQKIRRRIVSNTILIPVAYGRKQYPSHLTPQIEEIAAHFDKCDISPSGRYSLHTKYSYMGRRLNNPTIQPYTSLREAQRRGIPQLWYDEKWVTDFCSFILQLTAGHHPPEVIEIHPPFKDYCPDLETFVTRYERFEKLIASNFPDTTILIENRCGSRYSGSRFLISNVVDLQALASIICPKRLRLRFAIDIPQLFTFKTNDGRVPFTPNFVSDVLESLKPVAPLIGGIHLWGKRKNSKGRPIAHQGTLDSYFEDPEVKKSFLWNFTQAFGDGMPRYFIPEVNSSSEDLQAIISDLEQTGVLFDTHLNPPKIHKEYP